LGFSGLEAEDKARRAKADKQLNTMKLQTSDLNELDFTIKGKTGSCNSCYLGDAFRCAGKTSLLSNLSLFTLTVTSLDCPYIGLPAFKPGEEVKILNNVAQF